MVFLKYSKIRLSIKAQKSHNIHGLVLNQNFLVFFFLLIVDSTFVSIRILSSGVGSLSTEMISLRVESRAKNYQSKNCQEVRRNFQQKVGKVRLWHRISGSLNQLWLSKCGVYTALTQYAHGALC